MAIETTLLQPAVMSSSSGRPINSLFSEINKISGVQHFDLFLIRQCDFDQLGVVAPADRKLASIMADESIVKKTLNWVRKLPSDIRFPAIATYFPGITSSDKEQRNVAIQALVNTCRIALELQCAGYMVHAVLEIICGTIVECDSNSCPIVFGAKRKLGILQESLERVIDHFPNTSLGIGLEFEPGETYVLNKIERVLTFASKIQNSPLDGKVGFNLDIAHLRISGVTAESLNPITDLIVHSHISDHPGMHTHDQIVGRWTDVSSRRTGYQPYMELLVDRALQLQENRSGNSLPFTSFVAIELEGCNRVFSIHDSIVRLRHAIAIAESRVKPKAK